MTLGSSHCNDEHERGSPAMRHIRERVGHRAHCLQVLHEVVSEVKGELTSLSETIRRLTESPVRTIHFTESIDILSEQSGNSEG